MGAFNFTLNITGISDMGNLLNATGTAVEEAKNAAVDQIAQYMQETAEAMAEGGHPTNPEVQTGTLQQSILWTHVGDAEAAAYVDPSVEYAVPLEAGHAPSGWYANVPNATDVPPYPFFENMINQVENDGVALGIIEDLISAAMESQDGAGGEGDTVDNAVPDDVDAEADF